MQYFLLILNSREHNLSHRLNMKVRELSHICVHSNWNDAMTHMIKINTKQVHKINITAYFFLNGLNRRGKKPCSLLFPLHFYFFWQYGCLFHLFFCFHGVFKISPTLLVLTLTCHRIVNLIILVNSKIHFTGCETEYKSYGALKHFSSSIFLLREQNFEK